MDQLIFLRNCVSYKNEISAATCAGMIPRDVLEEGAEETLLHETAGSDLRYGDLGATTAAAFEAVAGSETRAGAIVPGIVIARHTL